MDGQPGFPLRARMNEQSGKLGTQASNMHGYRDTSGQKAMVVTVGVNTDEALTGVANRLLEEQSNRDTQLQVVANSSSALKGQTLQQLGSMMSAKGRTEYSAIVLGEVKNQLLTSQVTLPAD
ncbi:hypothetical protein AGQ50_24835, partial [Salmonella enterica subsp. enterica]